MFCSKCGAHLAEDARFCSQCGAPVTDESAPVTDEGAPVTDESAPVTDESPSDSEGNAPQQSGPVRSKPKRKTAVLQMTAAVLILVLIMAVPSAVRAIQARRTYSKACEAMEDGNYYAAEVGFTKLEDYKDSADQLRQARYMQARDAYDGGNYAAAMNIFAGLGDYQDCVTLWQQSTYHYGEELFNDGDYEGARAAFLSLDGSDIDCSDMLSQIELEIVFNSQVGDIVQFGRYEQDDDLSNGAEPIDWRVLAVNDGGEWRLLISEYSLECMPYNTTNANISWADSSVRAWLNEEFYYDAFNWDEQVHIGITNGADNVFMLYINDVERYFDDEPFADRIAYPTAHAQAQGGTRKWWLANNSPIAQGAAAYVSNFGRVETWGDNMNCTDICVRPGIWVQAW